MLLCPSICLHSRHSSSRCTSQWPCMCGYVLDDCVLCPLCGGMCTVCLVYLKGVRDSGGVSLALWSFPLALHVCNYIPSLIENRALPQTSLNKELLFPFFFCLLACVLPKLPLTPWVFPLILSSCSVPYRKLITDWLGLCVPLITHGAAWGCVWGLMETGGRTISMLSSKWIHRLFTWQAVEIWISNWSNNILSSKSKI